MEIFRHSISVQNMYTLITNVTSSEGAHFTLYLNDFQTTATKICGGFLLTNILQENMYAGASYSLIISICTIT